jgi:MOSC domain-containing protein YiiM
MTDEKKSGDREPVIGEVVAVCVGKIKGEQKSVRNRIVLKTGHGIQDDAHAGTEKEVSILSLHLVDQLVRETGVDAPPGCFAENIRIRWLKPVGLEIGTRLAIGSAGVKITSLGKSLTEKHSYSYRGFSLLAKQGIFGKVIRNGMIKSGDSVRLWAGKGQNFQLQK